MLSLFGVKVEIFAIVGRMHTIAGSKKENNAHHPNRGDVRYL